MPAVTLTPDDLAPFATIERSKALAMIDDALAIARRVAPCIVEDDFEHAGAARATLRQAILRWNDQGTGAVTQHGAGPFQQTIDTRERRRGLFFPSEIAELQELCATSDGGAFDIDTAGAVDLTSHALTCSLRFGAAYCSCGFDIAGVPIYGA